MLFSNYQQFRDKEGTRRWRDPDLMRLFMPEDRILNR